MSHKFWLTYIHSFEQSTDLRWIGQVPVIVEIIDLLSLCKWENVENFINGGREQYTWINNPQLWVSGSSWSKPPRKQ